MVRVGSTRWLSSYTLVGTALAFTTAHTLPRTFQGRSAAQKTSFGAMPTTLGTSDFSTHRTSNSAEMPRPLLLLGQIAHKSAGSAQVP